jgi:hypothetical protein
MSISTDVVSEVKKSCVGSTCNQSHQSCIGENHQTPAYTGETFIKLKQDNKY